MSVHTIVIEHMASLRPVECLRLSNAALNWKSLCFCHFGDSHGRFSLDGEWGVASAIIKSHEI